MIPVPQSDAPSIKGDLCYIRVILPHWRSGKKQFGSFRFGTRTNTLFKTVVVTCMKFTYPSKKLCYINNNPKKYVKNCVKKGSIKSCSASKKVNLSLRCLKIRPKYFLLKNISLLLDKL